MTRAGAVLAWLVAAAPGCVPVADEPPPQTPRPPPPGVVAAVPVPAAQPPPPAWYEVGRATFYSDRLAGHRTANGERYDPGALTAAHRRLPFGTVVDVVRPDGRAVRVRINDRGPFARGRIIDLSRRAAAEIGLDRDGVGEVALRVVQGP